MVVIVLTACPAGLRGHLTRWLLEISPGVFVGKGLFTNEGVARV